MKLIQSSETRKKRLATGVLLFITVLLIVWTALPCYSTAYDSGMEYSNEARMEIPAQGDITTYLLNLGKYIYHNRKRGS